MAVLVTATLLELGLFELGLVRLLPPDPPWALLALLLIIVGAIILDTAAIGLRSYRRRSPGGGLKGRRQQLQADGIHVLELAQFAAHPRGHRHGDQLVRQLLPHVPPTTALLVMAINETMADRYVAEYGFSRPDPKKQPMLLEREAAGPAVPREPSRMAPHLGSSDVEAAAAQPAGGAEEPQLRPTHRL